MPEGIFESNKDLLLGLCAVYILSLYLARIVGVVDLAVS